MDHIQISHSREEETYRLDRLNILKGYLIASLSPLDLKIIRSLHDHKGILTVGLDRKLFENANQTVGDPYETYLKDKLKQGWEFQHETEIEFELV